MAVRALTATTAAHDLKAHFARYPTVRTTRDVVAGCTPVPFEGLNELGPTTAATRPGLIWVNSPSNPTGKVLGVAHLRKVVQWARANGAVVASDECYAEIDWRDDAERLEQAGGAGHETEYQGVPSLLDPRVCDGDHTGLLVCYSLSKQSNLAGYRAAFVAGDPRLVAGLLEVRKHAGMIVPAPVQAAMTVALTLPPGRTVAAYLVLAALGLWSLGRPES